jgi:DNA repair protein RecN (Recombination protein N)
MLVNLRISSYALIDYLECDFSSGFTVLTGETGAGKSILVGALSLLSGAQAKESMIKDVKDSAEIEAVFELPHLSAHSDLSDYLEDGQLIVYRRISRKKASVCRINNRTVSVKGLKLIMRNVIEIIGQHAVYQLFDEESARAFLDRFISKELDGKLSDYRSTFSEMRRALASLNALKADNERSAEKERFLSLQISDISSKNFISGEDVELEERLKSLKTSVVMKGRLARIDACVESSLDGLQGALLDIQHAPSDDDFWRQFKSEAHEIVSKLNDYKSELSSRTELYESNSESELDDVESRLQEIDAYKEKYKCTTLDELLSYLEECEAQLKLIGSVDDQLTSLRASHDRLKTLCQEKATEISGLRKANAPQLVLRITEILKRLGFSHVDFTIGVEFSAEQLDEFGGDDCSFHASFNKGQAQRPLSQVASGGELSRLFLGLYTVVSGGTSCPTLVFDEVDVGVGGLTALSIGDTLQVLSENKQVFCVTHLAQIARRADHHFTVEKSERDSDTVTAIRYLNAADTATEIHRMVGGEDVVGAIDNSFLNR